MIFFHSLYFPLTHLNPGHLSQPALFSFFVTNFDTLICPGNQETIGNQKKYLGILDF